MSLCNRPVGTHSVQSSPSVPSVPISSAGSATIISTRITIKCFLSVVIVVFEKAIRAAVPGRFWCTIPSAVVVKVEMASNGRAGEVLIIGARNEEEIQ